MNAGQPRRLLRSLGIVATVNTESYGELLLTRYARLHLVAGSGPKKRIETPNEALLRFFKR